MHQEGAHERRENVRPGRRKRREDDRGQVVNLHLVNGVRCDRVNAFNKLSVRF